MSACQVELSLANGCPCRCHGSAGLLKLWFTQDQCFILNRNIFTQKLKFLAGDSLLSLLQFQVSQCLLQFAATLLQCNLVVGRLNAHQFLARGNQTPWRKGLGLLNHTSAYPRIQGHFPCRHYLAHNLHGGAVLAAPDRLNIHQHGRFAGRPAPGCRRLGLEDEPDQCSTHHDNQYGDESRLQETGSPSFRASCIVVNGVAHVWLLSIRSFCGSMLPARARYNATRAFSNCCRAVSRVRCKSCRS